MAVYLNPKNPNKKTVMRMLRNGYIIRKYQRMIFRIAHDLLLKHPDEDFDELISEAYHAIVILTDRYKNRKAGLSTYIYNIAWSAMKNYCLNEKEHRHIPHEIADPVFTILKTETVWIDEFLSGLTDDAYLLVCFVLSSQSTMPNVIKESSPTTTRNRIKKLMLSQFKWDIKRYRKAFQEVALCLSNWN